MKAAKMSILGCFHIVKEIRYVPYLMLPSSL